MSRAWSKKYWGFYLLSVALLGVLLVEGYRAKQVSGLAWQLTRAQVQVNGRTTHNWTVYQTINQDLLVASPQANYLIPHRESRIIRVSDTGVRVGSIWLLYPTAGVPLDGSNEKADFFNAELTRFAQQMDFVTPERDTVSITFK